MPYIIAIVVLLTWLVCMPLHFGMRDRKKRTYSLIAKVIPTLCAAAFAGYAVYAGADRYALLLFIGLLVCVLADWLLDVRFEIGGALFFAGHMLYIAGLSLYRALSWWSLAVFLLSLVAMWAFLWHHRPKLPKPHLLPCLMVYAVALAALLAFSVPLPFLAFSRRAVLAAVGAVLFVISDLTLCSNMLKQTPRWQHYVSLGLYYTGQLLLGLSAFPMN